MTYYGPENRIKNKILSYVDHRPENELRVKLWVRLWLRYSGAGAGEAQCGGVVAWLPLRCAVSSTWVVLGYRFNLQYKCTALSKKVSMGHYTKKVSMGN